MLKNNSHSLSRRTSLPLRWLAIGLLLFAQISFAGHYHGLGEVNAHDYDCAVCLQLHVVKNTAGSSSFVALSTQITILNDPRATAISLPSFNPYLPPCRAPPRH